MITFLTATYYDCFMLIWFGFICSFLTHLVIIIIDNVGKRLSKSVKKNKNANNKENY